MTNLTELSDEELLTEFRETVIEEQEWLGRHLEYIAELDRRQLFFHHASLRAYLSDEFGIEKWAADRRIRAARLIRRLPWIQEEIERGKLTITHLEDAMGCAARERLSGDELSELLESVCGMSTEAAKYEILARYPHALRRAEERLAKKAKKGKNEKTEEMAPACTAGEVIADRSDLDSSSEDKNWSEEESLSDKVERFAATRTEVDLKTDGRVPTAEMIYALIQRDGYQCSYPDLKTGKRCTSRFSLQVDHVKAWYLGGETKLSNLRYLCRSHHRRVSFLQFGESSQYFAKGA